MDASSNTRENSSSMRSFPLRSCRRRKDASVGCPSFPRVGFVPRVASGVPEVPSPNHSSEPVLSAANVATCFSSGSKRDPHSSRALQLSSSGRVDVSDSLDPLRLPAAGPKGKSGDGNLGTDGTFSDICLTRLVWRTRIGNFRIRETPRLSQLPLEPSAARKAP